MATTTSATGAPQQPSTWRRKFYRRSKPFQGVYYTLSGERVPLVGLNASGGGLCVLFQKRFDEMPPELRIGAVVEADAFTINGTIRWGGVVNVKGVEHYRYGLKMTAIADSAWDRLMLWTVENNPEFVEGATLSAVQRDELVTPRTQEKIAAHLRAKELVDPYEPGQMPLIEYNFVKYTMRHGIPYVWLRVRSRCTRPNPHAITDHVTNVLIGCNDGHMKILEAF